MENSFGREKLVVNTWYSKDPSRFVGTTMTRIDYYSYSNVSSSYFRHRQVGSRPPKSLKDFYFIVLFLFIFIPGKTSFINFRLDLSWRFERRYSYNNTCRLSRGEVAAKCEIKRRNSASHSQTSFRPPVNKMLDVVTRKQMHKPRCGKTDSPRLLTDKIYLR